MTLLGLTSIPIQTIIDVGANRGQFARYIGGFFPKAKLHCFEPLPAAADKLSEWVSASGANVQIHRLALGAETGSAKFWHHLDHDVSSSLLPATTENDELFPITRRREQLEVVVSTLDDEFFGKNVGNLGRMLVKLDVQGFEDRVIAGGRQVIGLADVVILEVSLASLYRHQATFTTILNELGELGLGYFGNLEQRHDRSGRPVYCDVVFVRNGLRFGEVSASSVAYDSAASKPQSP